MKIKKLIAVFVSLIILLSSLSLVGCSFSNDVMGLTIDSECTVNKVAKISYSQDTYDSTLENLQKLNDMVQKEEASDFSCQILCTLVSVQLYKLIDAVNVSMLYYYTNTADQINADGYMDLYSKYTYAFNEFKKLYSLFANSKYKTIFYGDDMTDEEIQELVDQTVTSDELVELNNQIVALQQEYDGFSTAQILGSDFDDLYTSLVTLNNSLSEIYGYDNYLVYSYENEYDREFLPGDTLLYTEVLSQGFVSTAETAYATASGLETSLGSEKIDELETILYSYFGNSDSLTLLDGFYQSLGDDIYSVFKQTISNGYYYIAGNKDAYQGAYTSYFVSLGAPYMYFASNYATVETFVHEFGHYLRYYFMGSDANASYELMETHSQGAEWLFMSYLSQVLEEDEWTYVVNDKFVNDSYSVALCAVVGASEVDVYSLDSLDDVDYAKIVSKWSKKVFGEKIPDIYAGYYTPEQYFRLVVVNNPGYYISYSVSLISSLELYVVSLSSYDQAVEVYVNLLNATEYLSTLTENGFDSPLSLEAIEGICHVFENA